MTYYQDIQNAQSILTNPYTGVPLKYLYKRLLIRTPVSLVEQFNPTKKELWRFDTTFYDSDDTSDYVYMVLFPDYKNQDQPLSGQEIKTGFSTPSVVTVSISRRSFNCNISQRQDFFYRIMERLVKISNTSTYSNFTPIKVIDTLLPEPSDDPRTVTSYGEQGTIRYGKIDLTKKPDGEISGLDGINYFLSDWEFKFSEIDQLRVC